VIITEYNLPRKTIEPHDVIVDADGIVWFSNVGEQFLGKLDPKTGAVSEYPVPTIRPGFPTGALDLETDLEGCRDSTRWPTQRQVRRRASSLARSRSGTEHGLRPAGSAPDALASSRSRVAC